MPRRLAALGSLLLAACAAGLARAQDAAPAAIAGPWGVSSSASSFKNYSEWFARVSLRRIAPGNLGMNLFYEMADTQGRSPYKNGGIWFSASPSFEWQTFTWHATNACFSKMWAYDISFQPEKSTPFVIGKVEVRVGPLR